MNKDYKIAKARHERIEYNREIALSEYYASQETLFEIWDEHGADSDEYSKHFDIREVAYDKFSKAETLLHKTQAELMKWESWDDFDGHLVFREVSDQPKDIGYYAPVFTPEDIDIMDRVQ